jgi:hypothetical protein
MVIPSLPFFYYHIHSRCIEDSIELDPGKIIVVKTKQLKMKHFKYSPMKDYKGME